MNKPPKPICPFCQKNLTYEVFGPHKVFYKVFYKIHFIYYTYYNYDGVEIDWIKRYVCRGCSKRYTTFTLWITKNNDLAVSEILLPRLDKEYTIIHYEKWLNNSFDIKLGVRKIGAKTSFETLTETKYNEPFDLQNCVLWGERALDKLLKLKALY